MTTTETKWAERIAAWRASGQTAEKFAEGKGFAARSLRWWGSELKRRAVSTPVVAIARVVRAPAPRADDGLLVRIGDATISVRDDFDPALLLRVVRALGAAR